MRALDHYGWFIFNIAIPLLAPLALLPLVKLPTFFREHSRGLFLRAVEHGQMLWAALPMSASACYVLTGVLGRPDANRELVLLSVGAHVCLLVASAAVIVLGAMESCVVQPNSRIGPNWILCASILLTLTTAGLHFLAYLHLVAPAAI